VLATNHPPVHQRIAELVPSHAAKWRAVRAYEDKLLEQLLVTELDEDEEEEANAMVVAEKGKKDNNVGGDF